MQPMSEWRDDRAWQRRVVRDRALLAARLDDDQLAFVRGMIGVADGGGALEFLVAFGSAARGEARPDSDVDVYFEARDLPQAFNRADPNGQYHAFGVPPGSLIGGARRGDGVALEILRDGIIVVDTGRFREVLIAADEEGLQPAAPAGA
jgi:hypothetical protein